MTGRENSSLGLGEKAKAEKKITQHLQFTQNRLSTEEVLLRVYQRCQSGGVSKRGSYRCDGGELSINIGEERDCCESRRKALEGLRACVT